MIPVRKLKTEENQLRPEFLNVNSLNMFPGSVSASRAQMFGSHLSQKLVISGAQNRYLLTGMEKEFGKYTFSIKAEKDIQILKVMDRYYDDVGPDSIALNPQTVVVYEDVETREVGIIDIPTYFSYHQYFGFAYQSRPAMSLLTRDRIIPEGTIFADSPAIGPNGEYMFGLQLNVAYMSHPAVSEDGIVVCRDVLPRLKFKTYEKRVGEFGPKKYPLNLYGTHSLFKAFPDIGEMVRPDGLLMAFRTYDPLLAPVEQDIYSISEPDFEFDEKIYVPPGGRVIDIRVYHDNGKQISVPELMEKQALKYAKAGIAFHQEIVNEARRLERNKAKFTPEFHRLVVESLGIIDDTSTSKIQKVHRATPLDDIRIEFTIEYETTPDIGFKLTDCHGGKAVICHLAEPHEMPVDEHGNRADIITDDISTLNRMNPARGFEQYFNCASRDVLKRLSTLLGVPREERYPKVQLTKIAETRPELFNEAMEYLLGYYKLTTPWQEQWIRELDTEGRIHHLSCILKDFIYLHIPTNSPHEAAQIVMDLEQHYRPVYGPVTYIGFSGNRVVTKKPVRVGPVYYMLLEKTGNDWSSVSSARVHHFGFLAPVSRGDKFSEPIRNQPVRANGEAETRIIVSTAGPRALAEVMDRNGSPRSHQAVVESILDADKPTNLPLAVDRNVIPLGGSKPLQLLEHVAFCSGFTFTYRKTS